MGKNLSRGQKCKLKSDPTNHTDGSVFDHNYYGNLLCKKKLIKRLECAVSLPFTLACDLFLAWEFLDIIPECGMV